MRRMTLGQVLRAVYHALEKPIPPGINSKLNKYTRELSDILIADGWKAVTEHCVPCRIVYESKDRMLLIFLQYSFPMPSGSWSCSMYGFSPWPEECSDVWKLEYFRAVTGEQFNSDNLPFGMLLYQLRIEAWLYSRRLRAHNDAKWIIVRRWHPENLIGHRRLPALHYAARLVKALGSSRIFSSVDFFEEQAWKNRTFLKQLELEMRE